MRIELSVVLFKNARSAVLYALHAYRHAQAVQSDTEVGDFLRCSHALTWGLQATQCIFLRSQPTGQSVSMCLMHICVLCSRAAGLTLVATRLLHPHVYTQTQCLLPCDVLPV